MIARIARYVLAAAMVVGPLVQVVIPLIAPWTFSTDFVTEVSTHVDGYVTVAWLNVLGAVTMAPAVIGVGVVASRGTPLLALIGTALAVPGMLNPDGNPGDLIYAGARSGVPVDTVTTMLDHLGELPATGWFGFYAFSVAFAIGGIILGVGLLRGRSAPRWAAAALIISAVTALVGSLMDLGSVIPVLAWGLAAAGFTGCAIALARSADRSEPSAPRPVPVAS